MINRTPLLPVNGRIKIAQLVFSISLLLCLGSALSASGKMPPPSPPACGKADASNPIRMLVLGDSIMWGQGLKEEKKFSYAVQEWLCANTGRKVLARREAHSGATIVSDMPGRTSPEGEINLSDPTVNQQVDAALAAYEAESVDAGMVDLVLVDGCINDVSADMIIDAMTTEVKIRAASEKRCAEPMEALLRKITGAFPRAWVVVTGYYPIFSEETKRTLLVKLLHKALSSDKSAFRMREQDLRERAVQVSAAWEAASNDYLSGSVEKINRELETSGRPRSVRFVKANFAPGDCFAAKDTLLWNFKTAAFSRHSFWGKIKFVLTFRFVRDIKPDDERLDERAKACNEIYNRDGVFQRVRCRYASLGHPNAKGARKYAQAIIGELGALVNSSGWLRVAPGASAGAGSPR
jgi:lysophospholipase L1-like esterase